MGSRWRSGIEDAVALTRESLPALAGDRRTHTVTPKQLDEALDALAAVLAVESADSGGRWPRSWRNSRSMPTPSSTSRER